MERTGGKMRGLRQLANRGGIFAMCAMDHRGSLSQMLGGNNPQGVTYQTMVDYKMDLCRVLAPHASGVLLDPIYGARQAKEAGVLPRETGLLVSLEETEYESTSEGRITRLLPDWGVEQVKRLGASAAKLLLYYRPDLPGTASIQLDIVGRLAEDCRRQDIALLVEPKSYAVGQKEKDPLEFARIKPDLVIETARQLTALPIDVLKAEFPAEMDYEEDQGRLFGLCQRLDEASRVPWVLLSGGVTFDVFSRQVEMACKAGASGFLAGRALWQEATAIPSRPERVEYLRGVVAPRLDQLTAIANAYGTAWYSRVVNSPKGAPVPVV